MKKLYRTWSASDYSLIQKLRDQGHTADEIARYFNVKKQSLYSYCSRHGIPFRGESPDDLDEFQIMRIKALRKKGWYMWEIAVNMALPETWLRNQMQKIGIENFPKGARK